MTTELERLAARYGIRAGFDENVGAAAARLGTTPRMLRYRESLGLTAPPRSTGGYRRYGEQDLLAAAYAAELEREYQVPPAALALAIRALLEPEVAGRLSTLANLARREPAAPRLPAAALDFEKEKAARLLRLAA